MPAWLRVTLTVVLGWVAVMLVFSFSLGVVASGTGRSVAAGARSVVISFVVYALEAAAITALAGRVHRSGPPGGKLATRLLALALLATSPLILLMALALFNR